MRQDTASVHLIRIVRIGLDRRRRQFWLEEAVIRLASRSRTWHWWRDEHYRHTDPQLAGRGNEAQSPVTKTDVLLMDDFAMAPMSDGGGRDLLEILDDRHGHRSTIATSQIPVENWHAALGDPTLADARLRPDYIRCGVTTRGLASRIGNSMSVGLRLHKQFVTELDRRRGAKRSILRFHRIPFSNYAALMAHLNS